MVEIFGELVNKNVGFGCIIMDQTGIRCTKCWNGGCPSSEHFDKFLNQRFELIKLRLSEFGYNSISAEFVFHEL